MKTKLTIVVLTLSLLLCSCAEVQMSPRMRQTTQMSATNVRGMADEYDGSQDVVDVKKALNESATALERILEAAR